jgi:beta-lactam-binding protein with PASTA domain
MIKKILGAISVTRALVLVAVLVLTQVRVVPNVYGMAQEEAIQRLEDRGLQVGRVTPYLAPGASHERCTVVSTSPGTNAFVLRGTPVQLVVSMVAAPIDGVVESTTANSGDSSHGQRC